MAGYTTYVNNRYSKCTLNYRNWLLAIPVQLLRAISQETNSKLIILAQGNIL